MFSHVPCVRFFWLILPQRIAPDPAGSIRKMFDGLFEGLRKDNEMVDDMFEGMETRGGLVEDCKGKARAASQQF